MPPETGMNGSLERTKDLDSLVTNFLAELEVLSHELQTPPEPQADARSEEVPIAAPAAEPGLFAEAAALQGRKFRWYHSRQGQILAAAVLVSAIFIAGWRHFQPSDRSAEKPAAPSKPATIQPSVPVPGRLNDMALLLAGLPVKPDSPLYRLSHSSALQRHGREMQLFWSRIQKGNLANIRRWREENIPSALERNPVLYPLSGADYLNAYSFFPRAQEYLLIALESPGSIPDISLLDETKLDTTLTAIRYSVQSLASANYLQSRAMREELTSSSFRGVVPVFLLLVAGFGHTIQSVQPVTIGPNGLLIPQNGESAPRKFRRVAGVNVPDDAVDGIRIQYLDGADGMVKQLTYLQIELRDQLFIEQGPVSRFLLGLKNRNTILKSAVYLLHGSNYRKVSECIREGSDLIIQDDSGIPYSHFASSTWEEHLFGAYTRPEPLGTLTNPPRQPQLAQQYMQGSRPLTFPYGYGVLWGKDRSNMMLFVKK